MPRGERGDEVLKSYKPSVTLTDYLKEELQLIEKRKRRKEAIVRGARNRADKEAIIRRPLEWNDEEIRERKRLNRRKSYILNTCIFPSMANLTVFLEHIKEYEELREVFDEDLRELFLGKNIESSDLIVFQRFIQSALTWNWKKKINANDFRLALIHCLEYILFQHITSIGLYLLDPAIVNSVVSPDLSRALAWAKSLAKNVDIDVKDISRPVLF